MKKYAYTETRKIDLYRLRAACIKHNWFDEGTNEAYEALFDMARKMENVTSDELVELATVICSNTSGSSALDDDHFCNVLFLLAQETCYSTFEVDR